ncbi:hypothetical protein Droror1_Dr00023628 [Drosera rotundifolia]
MGSTSDYGGLARCWSLRAVVVECWGLAFRLVSRGVACGEVKIELGVRSVQYCLELVDLDFETASSWKAEFNPILFDHHQQPRTTTPPPHVVSLEPLTSEFTAESLNSTAKSRSKIVRGGGSLRAFVTTMKRHRSSEVRFWFRGQATVRSWCGRRQTAWITWRQGRRRGDTRREAYCLAKCKRGCTLQTHCLIDVIFGMHYSGCTVKHNSRGSTRTRRTVFILKCTIHDALLMITNLMVLSYRKDVLLILVVAILMATTTVVLYDENT